MSPRLSGKVCIVTGTGGSVGLATAVTFAREGALLVGCDAAPEPAQETVEIVRATGGEMVSLHPCRLSDPAECEKLVELAVTEFGSVVGAGALLGRGLRNQQRSAGASSINTPPTI